MKTLTRPRRTLPYFLVVLVLAAIGFVAYSQHSEAGCTNYQDYLHWISSLELPYPTQSIYVQDNYEYIVEALGDVSYSLKIVDVTNESSPVVISSLEAPYNAHSVAVSGAIAALSSSAGSTDGLYMVDVSDPLAPEIIGSAMPGIHGTRLVMTDTLVYMLHNNPPDYSLMIVDITDPASPALRDSVQLPSQPTGRLIHRGDYVYVGAVMLTTVNVANPDSAFVADVDDIPLWDIRDITLYGDHIFVGARRGGWNVEIRAYSLSDPADPSPAGSVVTPLPGSSVFPYIAAAAGVCYIGYDTHYVWMYDVSNPSSMYETGHLPHISQPVAGLDVHGPNLYVLRREIGGNHGYVHAFSVSSPSPLEPIGAVDTPGEALDVAIAAGRPDLAYVADGATGVLVIDVTDPLSPVVVDTIDTPGYATDIELAGTMAYVADGSEGLQVIDVTTSAIVGSVDTPGTAVDLAVLDTLAYVADSAEGLRIVDITTPSSPVLRGVETALLDAQGVGVVGGVAYVAAGGQGVQSVDVSDPDNPWIIDGVKHRDATYAKKVDVVLDRVYVTDETAGLVIVDASDPGNLAILGDLATDNTAGDVNLLGLFAFVGSGAGMRLVDVQDGTSPVMVGGVDVPATARGIFANENYAYIAAGSAGLQVCPTQCGFDEAILAAFTPTPAEGLYPITVTFNNECLGYGTS